MRIDSASFLPLLLPHVCRNMATRIKHGAFEFLGSASSGDFSLGKWWLFCSVELSFELLKRWNQTTTVLSTVFVLNFTIKELAMRFWKLAMSDHSESFKPTQYISPHSDLFADPLSESFTASHSEVRNTNKNSKKIAADCLQMPVCWRPQTGAAPRVTQRSHPSQGKVVNVVSLAVRVQRISDGCGPSLKQGTSTTPLGLRECCRREGQKAHKSYEMGRRASVM